jgi:ribosomal protein S18 acetylase RimI-like enzyme
MRSAAEAVGEHARDDRDIGVRRLAAADVALAYRLSRAAQCAYRLDDWQFALRLGTGYVAQLDGEAVGTAVCWRFGRSHATVGMVIVAPQWRSRGVERRLLATVLAKLGARSVLMHAGADGRALFEELGFVGVGELRQHQGIAASAPIAELDSGERLRPLGRSDAALLAALDARAAGMPREAALAALLETSEGVVVDRDGELTGFALLRRSGRGDVIGPVVATDAEHAKALIGHWLGRRAGMMIRIAVPADSGLVGWLERLDLVAVSTATVMIRGRGPRRGVTARTFAAIDHSLG